jgi:hypothetical protein
MNRVTTSLTACLSLLFCGCEGDRFELEIQADATALIMPGSGEFSLDRESLDTGLLVFSYAPPDAIPVDQMISRVQERLLTEHGCYSVVHRSSSDLHVRCNDRSKRLLHIEEIRVAFEPSKSRVFVLWIRDVPADDMYQ